MKSQAINWNQKRTLRYIDNFFEWSEIIVKSQIRGKPEKRNQEDLKSWNGIFNWCFVKLQATSAGFY